MNEEKTVTQEMLEAAVKKAVDVGLVPKFAEMEKYLEYWDGIKKIIQAALNKQK